MGELQKAVRSGPRQKRRLLLAAEAAGELARASTLLRVRGQLPQELALAETTYSGAFSLLDGEADLQRAGEVGWHVRAVAARLPWRPTCLRQAVAVERMLRRRGIQCLVHLGVQGVNTPEPHAWVTVGGTPVVGGVGLERYTMIVSLHGGGRVRKA